MDKQQLEDDLDRMNQMSIVIPIIGWGVIALVGFAGYKLGQRSGMRSMMQ